MSEEGGSNVGGEGACLAPSFTHVSMRLADSHVLAPDRRRRRWAAKVTVKAAKAAKAAKAKAAKAATDGDGGRSESAYRFYVIITAVGVDLS